MSENSIELLFEKNEQEKNALPDGWVWSDLNAVCHKITDGTHHSPSKEVQTAEGDFKYITAKNIKQNGVIEKRLTYVPEEVHRPIYDRCNPEKGDVLYIKDGVTTGVATVNQLDEEFSMLSSVALLKPVREVVTPRFMKWYLNSPSGYNAMTAEMGGTAIKRLTLKKIKAGKIPLAPLPEQKRIVAKIEELFSDLDAGVSALERARANLRRYRASVLKSAVEGRLTKKWRNANKANPVVEPASALLARILRERRQRWEQQQLASFESKGKKPPKNWQSKYKEPAAPDTANLPQLPNRWCWATMGQMFQVQVGATPSRKNASYWNGDIPWASSGEIQFCRISETKETITEAGLQNSSTKLNPQGSVLLGMIGEGKTRGQVAILDIAACNNQNCAAIWVSETDIPPMYVYYFLWSQYEVTRTLGSGNNQPALNKTRVQAIPIPIPPLLEQKQIVEELDQQLTVLAKTEHDADVNILRSTRLRQSILRTAFAGELRTDCSKTQSVKPCSRNFSEATS